MVYPALLPPMRTPRLPAVDWNDATADLNGLVRFARKTNSGFCACAITFQLASTITTDKQNLWNVGTLNRTVISSDSLYEDKSNLTARTVWHRCLKLLQGMSNMATVSPVSDLMFLGQFLAVWNTISPCVSRESVWGSGVKAPLIQNIE